MHLYRYAQNPLPHRSQVQWIESIHTVIDNQAVLLALLHRAPCLPDRSVAFVGFALHYSGVTASAYTDFSINSCET